MSIFDVGIGVLLVTLDPVWVVAKDQIGPGVSYYRLSFDLPKARRWAEKAALLSGNDPHFQARLAEIKKKEKKAEER